MTTTSPPRRKWHFTRWLIVCIVAVFGWSGWRAYTFRSTVPEARALGWGVYYFDPVAMIRANWKAAFKKETWLNGVTHVIIPTSEEFEQHLAVVHRLYSKTLIIENASTLRDLSALRSLTSLKTVSLRNCAALTNVDALKKLSGLREVHLYNCTGLTNVDALKNLSGLREVHLYHCTGLTNVDGIKNLSALIEVDLGGCTRLTNVDALKNLSALYRVNLIGCTGLTKESVWALKAALPNAVINEP